MSDVDEKEKESAELWGCRACGSSGHFHTIQHDAGDFDVECCACGSTEVDPLDVALTATVEARDTAEAKLADARARVCPGECNARRERVAVALGEKLEAFQARDQALSRAARAERDLEKMRAHRDDAFARLKAMKVEKDALRAALEKIARGDCWNPRETALYALGRPTR